MFTTNPSEVVDCVEISLLSYCLHFYFGRRECHCNRRPPTVPKLLSIIIVSIFNRVLVVGVLCIYSNRLRLLTRQM